MLEIRDLTLHYGASQALRGVNLTVQPSRVTAVLGRNGVGKTSLLRGVVGRQPISGGTLRWNGEDISRLSPHQRARRGIAYVPQGREIFPLLTVRENLEVGFALLPRNRRRIPEIVFELFPVLKDMLHRRGGDLSGGQQQQLAIARALVPRPSLIVLDEPTEGIQPSIIKDIGRSIAKLRASGLAILLVEQYFEFARDFSDSFAIMNRGSVIMRGDQAEMYSSAEAAIRSKLAV